MSEEAKNIETEDSVTTEPQSAKSVLKKSPVTIMGISSLGPEAARTAVRWITTGFGPSWISSS